MKLENQENGAFYGGLIVSDLVERLLKRAGIRRSIKSRKSVQNNEPDRLSDLLEEAANKLDMISKALKELGEAVTLGGTKDIRNKLLQARNVLDMLDK